MTKAEASRRSRRLERFDHWAIALGQWSQALVEDHHTPVDKQAAFRLDFPAWLSRLAPRQRRIAASAKANQIEPFAYVRDLLVQLSGHSPPAAAALLPDAWLTAHPEARRCWSR